MFVVNSFSEGSIEALLWLQRERRDSQMKAFAAIVFICFSSSAFAQQAILSHANLPSDWSSPPSIIVSGITIEKKVREVSLVLSVVDRNGRFVDNLQEQDVTVFDNATQQRMLTFFQSQTDLPLDVAILLDVSSSVATRLEAEQDTIRAFVNK